MRVRMGKKGREKRAVERQRERAGAREGAKRENLKTPVQSPVFRSKEFRRWWL